MQLLLLNLEQLADAPVMSDHVWEAGFVLDEQYFDLVAENQSVLRFEEVEAQNGDGKLIILGNYFCKLRFIKREKGLGVLTELDRWTGLTATNVVGHVWLARVVQLA